MRRWIALIIVLSACLLTLLFLSRRPPQRVSAGVEQRSPSSSSAPASAAAHPSVAPAPAPEPAATSAVMDELCGVEDADRARQGDETLEAHAVRVTRHAVSEWQSVLAASEDPRRQALALALTNAEPLGHFSSPDELIAGNEPSRDTPANNDLVLLASQNGDPAVYSLAMGACRIFTEDMGSGSCQGLSWEHWASIDPDNGLPWLWIAAKARRAGDNQGVDSALAKAATAPRIESYASALSALALDTLPSTTTPLEKTVAGADLISILPVGIPLELISLCSATAIQPPLRKQQCSAIATTLAKQGSGFVDLVVADSLARRLGFPEDARAALTAERRNARTGLVMSDLWGSIDDVSQFRCAKVAVFNGYIDSLRAARGNQRAALTAIGTAGRSTHTP